MFYYEESATGQADINRIWDLYSDVSKWSTWDSGVRSVRLSGPFSAGTHGVMEMSHGPDLPFILVECSQMKGFTTKSEMGPMTITFEHALEEDAGNVIITHAVTIDGGEESQMDNIGKGITAGLAGCLKKLLSM
ncbi:SRPBCC family protein [Adlercreutzia mucosicola]|jgi:Polyketide cyclase / dehydrase and lipid transport.|uniref:hypothetical protein n=1 Tax=Adlercreutzia mucosicola TaxID=580026 RepID=UPI0006889457|nr:hypothetical protein [Adlercreutzia mucosicola]MCR2033980.1 hypothetical protein [Adlercreutzia mucosicola]